MSAALGFSLPPVFDSPRPLVFGHRGGAKLGPENTLVAFARGLAAGVDGFECDVRLSRDGVPVVIHDPTLDRTTDRTGPVSALTAADLAAVDATCRFAPLDASAAPPPKAGVPRLSDLLETFRGPRLILEIKDEGPVVAEAVADAVREAGAADRVCIGSFHAPVLEHVRGYAPDLTTSASLPEAKGTLIRSWLRWPRLSRAPYRGFQVPEVSGRIRVATPSFVRQAHREHAMVQVWVVDTPEDASRLFDLGVDGIITDRPDLTVAARDRWVAAREGAGSNGDGAQ